MNGDSGWDNGSLYAAGVERRNNEKVQLLLQRIEPLQGRVERLEVQLRTLIIWMAQSANSPISHHEAKELIDRIGLS